MDDETEEDCVSFGTVTEACPDYDAGSESWGLSVAQHYKAGLLLCHLPDMLPRCIATSSSRSASIFRLPAPKLDTYAQDLFALEPRCKRRADEALVISPSCGMEMWYAPRVKKGVISVLAPRVSHALFRR